MATTNTRRIIQMGMILLSLFLLGGCAHTWSPRPVSPVPMESVGPLSPGLSVHLVNNQPLTTPQLFDTDMGHTHYANYNEWTDFFIRYWGEELTKRGVVVDTKSRNTISVKLDDFYANHVHIWVFFGGMKVHLSSLDNSWRKEFSEMASSGGGLAPALGNAINLTVEKLMRDPEVLDRMKP
jgi:hypothetical protein